MTEQEKKSRFCGGSDGDAYERFSRWCFVSSCNKPDCKEKADERIEEIMEEEDNE